jgi:Cu(I)/Ag(I) efflux system membrane fusion protein
MNHSTRRPALVGLVVVLAIVIGLLIRQNRAHQGTPGAANEAPRYWYDPMHPGQHFDKSGKSPFMDMQLVPKYADQPPSRGADGAPASDARGSTAIDSRVIQTLGVRLAAVEQTTMAHVVDTVGLVGVDEHRIEIVQVREPGWVERLDVRALGDSVHRGQLLAGIYSPNLLATQEEFLIARSSGDSQLIDAARRRLTLFGVTPAQIAHIDKTGQVERQIKYYAPFDGYVMELGVRRGAAVQPGATLFQLADLTSIWITAEVPERQAGWIKAGDAAEAELSAQPGQRFVGHVDYLYPELSQATRTLKVRVVLKNLGGHLRPGMFATVHLHGAAKEHVLTVPGEAVIKTGTRCVIIVADDATHFRPAPVRIGTEYGGRSEILEGLTLGQTIVASGQFLIDSEANLRGAFENLTGPNDKGTERVDADRTPVPSNGAH